MRPLQWVSLFAENFKCFGDIPQGFESIKPINIIIGRNNAGKTALLDLLYHAVTKSDFDHRGYKRGIPEIYQRYQLTAESINFLISSEHIADAYKHDFLKYCGMDAIVPVGSGTKHHAMIKHPNKDNKIEIGANRNSDFVLGRIQGLFQQYSIRRISAERDIKPEVEHDEIGIADGGDGATNAIQAIINQNDLPSDLIEEKLRTELNSIFRPDAEFTRITVQKEKSNGRWEIYLEEQHKGRIRMSETGSGLKTILLVLINLLVVPQIEHRSPKDYLFLFEEIENNLHPALQKRLFKYLRAFALDYGVTLFLTTHSHIVVDLFSRDDQSQIIHVVHDGEKATASVVSSFLQSRNVFKDLDVRASDLLQTNAIVWVEGPSDRIYFNRWIELWSDGDLKENVDYQCVTYGGSLLASYSLGTPEERVSDDGTEDFIQALRINPNFIIIADSDKRDECTALKPRVERIIKEVGTTHGIVWITKGREVENYIPVEALRLFLDKPELSCSGPYENVFDMIEKHGGRKWEKRKTDLAKVLCGLFTKDMVRNHLDLENRLDEICQKIRFWNSERPPVSTTTAG